MLEEKVVQELQCPKITGNYEADIREIVKRLGEGAETFVEHTERLNAFKRELELIWEWKKNQNHSLEKIRDSLSSLNKEVSKEMERLLDKQKTEIEELVKPVCEAVGILQKGADAKDTVKAFKGKVVEGALKYLTGGTALILAFWKIFDLVKGAMAAKGN